MQQGFAVAVVDRSCNLLISASQTAQLLPQSSILHHYQVLFCCSAHVQTAKWAALSVVFLPSCWLEVVWTHCVSGTRFQCSSGTRSPPSYACGVIDVALQQQPLSPKHCCCWQRVVHWLPLQNPHCTMHLFRIELLLLAPSRV